MAVAIELALGAEAAALERVMTALDPHAWAFELYGKERPVLLALIPEHDPELACERARAAIAPLRLATAVRARSKLPDSWVAWSERARMVQVGPLWIASPSVARRAASTARVLSIESKNAFGSGLHDTTALCLERVLELAPSPPLLDVGAGSGVLSLVSVALGAPRAVGVEIDPVAVAVANENARRNAYADRFYATTVAPAAIGARFPLVLANIIARVLVELAPQIAPAVEEGGRLVLCGMRADDVAEVAGVYAGFGLKRSVEAERGGWVRLDMVRV